MTPSHSVEEMAHDTAHCQGRGSVIRDSSATLQGSVSGALMLSSGLVPVPNAVQMCHLLCDTTDFGLESTL